MAVKISALGNLTSWSDSTLLPAVDTSGTFTTVKSNASILKTYVLGTIPSDISTLYSNAASQASEIFSLQGQIISANVGLLGYINLANTIQSSQITQANVGLIGYINQTNLSLKGYTDFANTIQSGHITQANLGMKGYVDFGNTIQSGSITQANTGMKGYVDNQILTLSNNISTSKISSDSNNVAVNGSYVNVAIVSANVASFSATELTITGNLMPAANNVSNLGSPTLRFNTVHAQATSAQYADLAENYVADSQYSPGTVLEFGGEYEVTVAAEESIKVAGVVSSNPAYLMNSNLEGETITTLALMGRVPCQVVGKISKGDMLVSAGNGKAKAKVNPVLGSVVGKALEDFDDDAGIIEVVVGRL